MKTLFQLGAALVVASLGPITIILLASRKADLSPNTRRIDFVMFEKIKFIVEIHVRYLKV
jgi:hypothetical protein